MEVHFRVDSSNEIGLGHLSRCLNLADALNSLGHTCNFFCRDLPEHSTNWVTRRGYGAHVLKTPSNSRKNLSERQDFELYCERRTCSSAPDWIVLDIYSLGRNWEDLAKDSRSRLLVIDDFIDRPHHADLYLNQNLIKYEFGSFKTNEIKANRFLLGPKYALLSIEYSDLRESSVPRAGSIDKIFVYFGGVDKQNFLIRSLECVIEIFGNLVSVVVVAPEMGANYHSVLRFCDSHENIEVFKAGKSLAKLIMESQLAIGAFGATTWERACLGLPTLGVVCSRNQLLVAKNASESGACFTLPKTHSEFKNKLCEKLIEYRDSGLTKAWSQRCFEVCDGRGAQRTANEIESYYSP